MAERYTRDDVTRILESINEAARSLNLRGAGNWTVETMGGDYLYLTDRTFQIATGRTGPGEKIEDLGKSWHRAFNRLFDLRRDLLTVQLRQGRDRLTSGN